VCAPPSQVSLKVRDALGHLKVGKRSYAADVRMQVTSASTSTSSTSSTSTSSSSSSTTTNTTTTTSAGFVFCA